MSVETEGFVNAYSIWEESSWKYLSDNLDLPSHFDVEQEVIHRDLLRKLSQESKKILDIIFNADDDLLRLITTPKTGQITKRSLMNYLWATGTPYKTIVKCFKELTILVRDF